MVSFPKDLRTKVDQARKAKNEKERKRKDAIRQRVIEEERIRRARLKEGLSSAKFIFNWAEEFRKNKNGKKLIDLCRWTYLGGIMFFDDKLEDKPWFGLGVSLEGLWWMRNGCGARPQVVSSARELAIALDPEILKAACESIKNKKVWECIRNRWELQHSLSKNNS